MKIKNILVTRWVARGILIVLALIPFIYWQPFYDHFYVYLTGTIISNVITTKWSVVIFFILFFIFFLIPLNYRRRAKWIDYSLAVAFFMSLFIEMYGMPLTILFASKYFFTPNTKLPNNVIEFNFLGVGMGMDHAMFYGAVLMVMGIFLITFGWWSLYRQAKRNTFAKTGLYSISRHPQYLGFIFLLLGWFFGWPTIITIIFSPILIYKYIRAAHSEEKEMEAVYGQDYHGYCKKTPLLI